MISKPEHTTGRKFHLLEVRGSGVLLASQHSTLGEGLGYPLSKSWTFLTDIEHQAEVAFLHIISWIAAPKMNHQMITYWS